VDNAFVIGFASGLLVALVNYILFDRKRFKDWKKIIEDEIKTFHEIEELKKQHQQLITDIITARDKDSIK